MTPMPSTNYDDDDDDDEEDQSVSMGGSGEDGKGHDLDDGESSIPMKRPSNNSSRDDDDDHPNANDSSFLDDDFLTFSSVDNGGKGGGDNDTNGRRRGGDDRRRCPPPAAARSAVLVPWLEPMTTTTTTTTTTRHRRQQQQEQPRQQQRWVGRDGDNSGDRGYDGIFGSDRDNHRHRHPARRDAPPPLIRLHNEIVAFVNLMSPTAAEMSLRDRVVESVTRIGSSTFGDGARVLPFGSQVTGLCLPGSDVDFVVRLPPPPKGGGGGGAMSTTTTMTEGRLMRLRRRTRTPIPSVASRTSS